MKKKFSLPSTDLFHNFVQTKKIPTVPINTIMLRWIPLKPSGGSMATTTILGKKTRRRLAHK